MKRRRPELNGQKGTCGDFDGDKGRYLVKLDGGEAVMIKMVNLLAIGDEAPRPPSSVEEQD